MKVSEHVSERYGVFIVVFPAHQALNNVSEM